jgi:hypothetical protein
MSTVVEKVGEGNERSGTFERTFATKRDRKFESNRESSATASRI